MSERETSSMYSAQESIVTLIDVDRSHRQSTSKLARFGFYILPWLENLLFLESAFIVLSLEQVAI